MNLGAPSDFSEPKSLYEVLDLEPDASPQDIRSAYLRAKASYQRDSLALYSLMGESDAADMLRQIEEAFVVLSNPDRRKLYDQSYRSKPNQASVTSIDRVPPMSNDLGGDDLLIPPSTDFSGTLESDRTERSQPIPRPEPAQTAAVQPAPAAGPQAPMKSSHSRSEPISTGLELREVRERQGVSLEYLAEITRIRKSYLNAIETESFETLPAPVFIRGFLHQLARELHLPPEPMATRYLERYSGWKQSRDLSASKKPR